MGAGRSVPRPAFRFEDPFGHVFELYFDTNRYQAPAGQKAA